MEKMYAIPDDARGEFVEERGHALRLDDQRPPIDAFKAGGDFAARRPNRTAVAWIDRPARRQRQVQV